jgi:similar to spore coat protein
MQIIFRKIIFPEVIALDKKDRIAPHETFELHEILSFKNVCATKAATMSGFVKDPELKAMLNEDFARGQGHISELQELLQASEYAPGNIQ